MNPRHTFSIGMFVVAAIAVPLAGQAVTLSLTSPQDGILVAPGATVAWTIVFSDSIGDNAGLALLAVDLTQDPTNPAPVEITPADAVPLDMANFARPMGIANPSNGTTDFGYRGARRTPVGASGLNLLQIGGAQNTFGQPLAPGSGVGENANIVVGIGQSGSVILASGSFTSPMIPGIYTFQLENAVANVLTIVNTPPQFSPVVSAGMVLTAPSFSFSVPCNACDVNCDGHTNGGDIQLFVGAALSTSPQGCSPCAGDTNGSGSLDDGDIVLFVECLIGP